MEPISIIHEPGSKKAVKMIRNNISRKLYLKFQEGGGDGDDMGGVGVDVEGG